MSRASAVGVGLMLALLAGEARAATIKFCVTTEVRYHDSGQPDDDPSQWEDYWADTDWEDANPGLKWARGARLQVVRGSTFLWAGYLGDDSTDGLGCTPALTVSAVNATYSLTITSYGAVNGNYLDVRDENGDRLSDTDVVTVSDGQATQYRELSIAAGAFWVFNTYQAAAYALYRHNGGNSGEWFNFYVGPNSEEWNDYGITLHDYHAELKFIIVHETGHEMGRFRTDTVWNNLLDYSINEPNPPPSTNCPAEGTNGNHSIRSEEYSTAAGGEGLASFYAADVFNDHGESDCWLEYHDQVGADSTPKVNCENSTDTPDFDDAYLEAVCGPVAGRGTWLDWTRAFWDVHTDGSPAPTFTAMLDWIAASAAEDNWENDNLYQELGEEANEVGGQINVVWDWTTVQNGVDH